MLCRAGIGPLLGLAIITVPDLALAGAWTLPEGQGHVALIGTWSNATQIFDPDGATQGTARTNKFELQGLVEYGVRDWFTLIVAPGLQHVTLGEPVNAYRSGLGFSEVGGRFRLFGDASWVVSAQTTLRAPGVFEPINPASIGYSNPEGDVRLLLGKSGTVGEWPAYVDLQLAQRFRFGGPPDEFRADITFGLRPAPSWLVLAQSFNVFAEGSGPPVFPNYAYHKLQVSVVYDLSSIWSVQFGAFTTFAGHNALQENGMLLGTWYRF